MNVKRQGLVETVPWGEQHAMRKPRIEQKLATACSLAEERAPTYELREMSFESKYVIQVVKVLLKNFDVSEQKRPVAVVAALQR